MPHVTDTEYQMMVDAMAKRVYDDLAGTYVNDNPNEDNPYELASTRFERANSADHFMNLVVNRVADLVNAEVDAATANLRQYEKSPGVPKYEYLWHVWNAKKAAEAAQMTFDDEHVRDPGRL